MKKYIDADVIKSNIKLDGMPAMEAGLKAWIDHQPSAKVLDEDAIKKLKAKIEENSQLLWEYEGCEDYCSLLDELIPYIEQLVDISPETSTLK